MSRADKLLREIDRALQQAFPPGGWIAGRELNNAWSNVRAYLSENQPINDAGAKASLEDMQSGTPNLNRQTDPASPPQPIAATPQADELLRALAAGFENGGPIVSAELWNQVCAYVNDATDRNVTTVPSQEGAGDSVASPIAATPLTKDEQAMMQRALFRSAERVATPQDQTAQLLPCPFCGAAPILHEADPLTGHQPVECPTKNCVLSLAWPGVPAWQKRAAPIQQTAQPTNNAPTAVGNEGRTPAAMPAKPLPEAVQTAQPVALQNAAHEYATVVSLLAPDVEGERKMSDRADQLLRAWVNAIDEHSRRAYFGKTLRETEIALYKAEDAARAYLSENQPINDAGGNCQGAQSATPGRFDKPCPYFPDRPCYPPLCADGCKDARYVATPQDQTAQPVAWMYQKENPKETFIQTWRLTQLIFDWTETPLYASVQPIVLLDALRKITRQSVVTEMHDTAIAAMDAFTKSSGGENG